MAYKLAYAALSVSISFSSVTTLAQDKESKRSTATRTAVRISNGELEREAVSKVEPEYPPIARAARASGDVKVEVVIDGTGKIISARPISGHPLLRHSALMAARQWKFKPAARPGRQAKRSGLLNFSFILEDSKDTAPGKERTPSDPADAHISRGTAFLKSYRLDEAIAELGQVVRLKPDDVYARAELGFAYIAAERYAEAETACEKALTLPRQEQRDAFDLTRVLMCIGEAKHKLGKYDEAIKAFKQAAELNPEEFDVRIQLAGSQIRKGDNEGAISALKESLALKPENAQAHYILAAVYVAAGRLNEAIPEFKQAIRLDPEDAHARFGLGMTYAVTGAKQSALREYRILKKLDKKLAEDLLSNINQ